MERAQSVLPPPRKASDLAEWTSTRILLPRDNGDLIVRGRSYSDCRIVRGGSRKLIQGDASLSASDYAADNSIPFPAGDRVYARIGLRCVRSAKPRFFTLVDDPN